jgi:two-component system chemotaxis response regulator CheY
VTEPQDNDSRADILYCYSKKILKGRREMKKVLLVDDSISVARQLEKILAESGDFQVVGHGKNGLEAIKMHQSLQPDIICMDMNMPGMDGITALRTLMSLDRNVKVVMITSLGGVGDKFNEAIKLGARNVISKPFEIDNVLRILREL